MKLQEKANLEGMFVYQGFVFGHYDSRGGSTFIESNTSLTETLDRYVEILWVTPKSSSEFRMVREGIDDELIGEAILVSPVKLKRLDLEVNGEALVQNIPGADEGDFLPNISKDSKFIIEYVPNGKKLRILKDVIHPRWDDDAYGLLFIGKDLTLQEYMRQSIEECRKKLVSIEECRKNIVSMEAKKE